MSAVAPPAQPARTVVNRTGAIAAPSAARTEPPLKPNQPKNRMKVPSTVRGAEWPGSTLGLPSLPNLPIRGPRMAAVVIAAAPPVRWTIPEPAKSVNPSSDNHPPPHVQWPITG